MNRAALSLSLLLLAMAPTAGAEGTRSLGVTVSPVGAFAIGPSFAGHAAYGPSVGYTAGLSWAFQRPTDWAGLGGHVGSSALFTEATPVRVAVAPFPRAVVSPYVAVGLSLLVAHPGTPAAMDASLRVGPEAAAGAGVSLSAATYLAAEGRLQSFSLGERPFSTERLTLATAFLGVGFRL